VLPGDLQVEAGSVHLRRRLDGCALDTWLAFENRRAIFPIHGSMRFVIVTGTTGPATVVDGRHLRPFGVALGGVRRAIRASDLSARLAGEAGPAWLIVTWRPRRTG
jgi:hypothetical protein